jgi:hypothetical protein
MASLDVDVGCPLGNRPLQQRGHQPYDRRLVRAGLDAEFYLRLHLGWSGAVALEDLGYLLLDGEYPVQDPLYILLESDHGCDRITREHRQVLEHVEVGRAARRHDQVSLLDPQRHDPVLA